MWIDIEDSAGIRLGAGPIVTALGWTHTRRLGITEDVPATATLQVRNGVVTGYTT